MFRRTRNVRATVWLGVLAAFALAVLVGCAKAPANVNPYLKVAPNSTDPAAWAELYPTEYAQWFATSEPRPDGMSKYKRGNDAGVVYDKLSEYPFMATVFKGWGFGIEYNEPRGHWWMVRDQKEIDPSRVKAGGACLTCKSPSADALYEAGGKEFMSMPYLDAVDQLPEGQENLGVSCIDCHDNASMALRSTRWTVESALADIGKGSLSSDESELIVCAQCHVTYSVMKEDGQSVDVSFPWQGGSWGDISVETIIKNLKGDDARLEWTQAVTGYKIGFIRHPDFEFYNQGSFHAKAGVTCPDCHMPETGTGDARTANHDIMSPLKLNMAACAKCHADSPEVMRDKVIAIQDKSAEHLMRAGYAVAANAKLIELVNSQVATQSAEVKPAYDQAKDAYLEAFYRVNYMGAENSVGFHNPAEADRILADALNYSAQVDSQLRTLCLKAGVAVPEEIDLGFQKALQNRGDHKLGFVGSQIFADAMVGVNEAYPKNAAVLESLPVASFRLHSTAAEALAAEAKE